MNRWNSIAFFAVLHLGALIGIPLYSHWHGTTTADVALFALYGFASVLAIGVGYHRLFSHAAFRAHPVVQFVVLFFGAATFQQSALKWSSLHRQHHRYVDTEYDPYNIQSGFFYAHIGWILFWKHPVDYANVQDLRRSRLVTHQHEHFQVWAILAGIAVPLAIGALTGNIIGAAVWGVLLRLVVVFHVTFFINSYAHTFGSAPYDARSSARDHWLGALLTNGEGYHNFHHRFPSDYRNGVLWYQWDPSKWVIWTLSRLGLATHVKRTPAFRMMRARLDADLERASLRLERAGKAGSRQELDHRHAAVLESVEDWRQCEERKDIPAAKAGERRSWRLYREWTALIGLNPAAFEFAITSLNSGAVVS